MAENMAKKPDKQAKPNDQDRKLESGFGNHCLSISALIPNMVTDVPIRPTEIRKYFSVSKYTRRQYLTKGIMNAVSQFPHSRVQLTTAESMAADHSAGYYYNDMSGI